MSVSSRVSAVLLVSVQAAHVSRRLDISVVVGLRVGVLACFLLLPRLADAIAVRKAAARREYLRIVAKREVPIGFAYFNAGAAPQ